MSELRKDFVDELAAHHGMICSMGSLNSRSGPDACRQQLRFLFLLDHVVHGLRRQIQHRNPESTVLETKRAAPLRGP